MSISEYAGQPAPPDLIIDLDKLISDYYSIKPDPSNPLQTVSFGTSGHRGTSPEGSFNEDHVLAISQAICEYRASGSIDGPLFIGMDTHALSDAAQKTAVEVFAGNGVEIRVAEGGEYTPTPVISHAILTYNQGKKTGLADGVVITPSHNPPTDGGFKYNPPTGGPAGTDITSIIESRANEILAGGLKAVRRLSFNRAMDADTTREYDFIGPYVNDLINIIDMEAIAASGLRIGVDPMGGSGIAFWEPISELYGLGLTEIGRAHV